jgi:hypothetical protein
VLRNATMRHVPMHQFCVVEQIRADTRLLVRNRDDRLMKSRPSGPVWMGVAFTAAALLAIGVLAREGAGKAGVVVGLQATARLAFLFFWPSYVGGSLVTLFGPAFQPVKLRGRELGLAFASVLAVHLGLVSWLCLIGSPPPIRTFAIFGVGAILTYSLALLSIERVARVVDARVWQPIRTAATNYVALIFILDFVHVHQLGSLRSVAYFPFATLALLGPVLRLISLAKTGLVPRPPGPHVKSAAG